MAEPRHSFLLCQMLFLVWGGRHASPHPFTCHQQQQLFLCRCCRSSLVPSIYPSSHPACFPFLPFFLLAQWPNRGEGAAAVAAHAAISSQSVKVVSHHLLIIDDTSAAVRPARICDDYHHTFLMIWLVLVYIKNWVFVSSFSLLLVCRFCVCLF